VNYATLRQRLLEGHQILEAPPETRRSGLLDPKTLEGIVVDDEQAVKTGAWQPSRASGSYLGIGYVHDGDARDGKASLAFQVNVPAPGRYQVRVLYPVHENRATNVAVQVRCDGALLQVKINQRAEPAWLGPCRVEKSVAVSVGNQGADGYVVVDGLQVKRISN